MKRILLVDGNPLMWRAAHSKGEYQVSSGILQYFFDLLEKFNCQDVLLFWDSGKSRWRSNYYPEYKAHRAELKAKFDLEVIEDQKKFAKQVLSYWGVRSIQVYGVEADDLITWFSEYMSKVLGYQVVIATRDRDLWQLVSPTVKVYDQLSDLLVDEGVVHSNFGFAPSMVPDFKALVGDTSDNIKGVPGIGEKTAATLLQTYGGIRDILRPENAKELLKKKSTEKVLTHSETFDLTYQLVKLPALRDARTFLSIDEFNELRSELTKDVTPDSMSATVETEALGVRAAKRYVSSLAEELCGILPHFVPEPAFEASTLSQVDESISKCLACGYCDQCPYLLPSGNAGNQIMLVLPKPCVDPFEYEEVKHFLDLVDLTYDDCWTTFVVKSTLRAYLPLTFGEVISCSRFLRAEIDLVKPKMIIAFGNEALQVLTPYGSGASAHCGEVLEHPTGSLGYINSHVGVMVSPATAARSRQGLANFEYGAHKIKEFLDSKRVKHG